ncbi:MAG TPA: tRNA 2-thiouridine(34) synthase MnmA [Candidatus Paceibacterota bacterium]|nr:tRNA 2-thiouridine(34) synthase MnmA [Candidatus Paceibacterota bacterium]
MKTVYVGLSGGVDSAVSAALLKEQGFDVVGAFIKIWSPEFIECTWQEDRLDAMRVCAALQIPFREIDLSEEYKREVVRSMIEDYQRGITPNPDVLCNRSIKFGHFATWAFASGADRVATGHYARIREVNGQFKLLRALDPNKDQSYFLYRLGQSDLSRTLFPIGGYKKSDVRALAKKFDLPNAEKPDSQGLCFVGDVSMKDFLGRFITLLPGDVVDENGKIVGTHDGAALYTVGERHGFTSAGSEPKYVVGTDVPKNIVHVSSKREAAARRFVSLLEPSWVHGTPAFPLSASGQARYREPPFRVSIEARKSALVATFESPRIAAPGQSLVLYDGDTCLGGGIINNASA